MTAWAAPEATSAVDAVVALPGSKSLTNRLLVLAALADGHSRIAAPLRARDSLLMVAALRGLGVEIADGDDAWTVTPGTLHGGSVDVGLSGTVMRFVPPLAGLATGRVGFDGDAYARERPMATLVDGLRQAGIEVQDDGRDRLPFAVLGAGAAPGGSVRIDASASSQFVSGLLLAGARFDKGLELVHAGDRPVPSQPHVDMTVDVLRTVGVEVDDSTPGTWVVAPGPVAAREWQVEPDLSNAAPFLAAALVTGGSVTVPGWPRRTTQAGDALRELLARMGGDVVRTDEGLTVRGTGVVHGIDADLGDVGELTPTIAALAALADSPSILRGIAHLRGHETDRLAALRTELTALGGDISEEPDGLTIRPRPLRGGTWHAYADHRMATAGAVLGLLVPGVEVDDIASTSKTLPDFAGMWSVMLGA